MSRGRAGEDRASQRWSPADAGGLAAVSAGMTVVVIPTTLSA